MSAVSSANLLHLVCKFVQSSCGGGGGSIVYTRKRRGPRTEPAGIDFHDDMAEPTLTRPRQVSCEPGKGKAMTWAPRCSSLARRPACQTMAKDFHRSKKQADTVWHLGWLT